MKKEKSKEIALNQIIFPLLFIFLSLLLEIINFIVIDLKMSGTVTQIFPREWLFDVGAVLIIAGLIFIVKNQKVSLALFIFFIFAQACLNTLNANIFEVFGDMFTADYFILGDEAFAAIRFEFIDFAVIAMYLSIFAMTVTFAVLLYKRNKKTIRLKKLSYLSFALVLLLSMESVGVTLYSCEIANITQAKSETIENNLNYLYESFQFKTEAYQNFGYYGFYTKNFLDAIFGKTKPSTKDKEELINYINEGKTQFPDLDGSLANDNLIVILCESHEWFAYDEINTPFVWKLMTQDAAAFTGFYGHNKTNISEGIVLSGNMPQQTTLESLVSGKEGFDYSYTLPKLFKQAHSNEKVVANYFHTWKRYFYSRDDTYLQDGIGFDNFYSHDNFSKADSEFFGDWIRDSEFVEEFADEFVPDKDKADKFMSFFATMTTHGPYTYENPRFADLYQKYDENLEEYKTWLKNFTGEVTFPENEEDAAQLRRYKVGAMEFDRTVAKIFEILEEKDRLEDTTIVLFADHNSYYDNMTYKLKGVDKTDYSNIKVHNIPLLIYNSKITPGVYTQFCNTYDIFPTICELHGLTYNKNLTQGYNIFSEDIKNSFFASHLGGMFNENYFSKNISDVVDLKENLSQQDLENFKQCAERFYQRQRKLEQIYSENLAK